MCWCVYFECNGHRCFAEGYWCKIVLSRKFWCCSFAGGRCVGVAVFVLRGRDGQCPGITRLCGVVMSVPACHGDVCFEETVSVAGENW